MAEDIEPIVCTLCDQTIDEGDERRFNDGSIACENCTVWCEDCQALVNCDESITDGYNYYCNDCGKYCERCNSAFSGDDYFVSSESWCEPCYENYTFYCEPCGTSYSDREDYYEVDGNTWCDDCTSRNAWYCDDCDTYAQDGTECGNCGSDGNGTPSVSGRSCSCRRVIHEYSCKPSLVFHGDSKRGVYMGFELETQIRGGSLDEAAQFTSTALATDSVGIIKHDASIGRDGYDGFEIVTQPHTHLQYREHSATLWDTINILRNKYGARSWDTKSCGLHIHVSRAGFSSGAHMHRFISFVYSNAPHMMRFAGRKTDYARFNDVYTFNEYDQPVRSFKHKVTSPRRSNTERYSAVNTQNMDTLELRFFRGTMNTSTILSALDLVQAMVEYTRDLRLDEVKLGALDWTWFADYVRDNNGLYPDLYSRLDTLASVSITNPTLENA
jgi:hypothetical protein